MIDKKVSVIIPIYKVEKYLDKCIQSVFNQTYKNLEIILVDDGSPDLCPTICDQYKEQDQRIVVVHKSNGGLSDARNAGMRVVHHVPFHERQHALVRGGHDLRGPRRARDRLRRIRPCEDSLVGREARRRQVQDDCSEALQSVAKGRRALLRQDVRNGGVRALSRRAIAAARGLAALPADRGHAACVTAE